MKIENVSFIFVQKHSSAQVKSENGGRLLDIPV